MSRKHVLAKTTVRSLFGEGWVGRHGVPAFDTMWDLIPHLCFSISKLHS